MRRLVWVLFLLVLCSDRANARFQLQVNASRGFYSTHSYFEDAIACGASPLTGMVAYCAEGYHCAYIDWRHGFACSPGEIYTVHCGGLSFCPRGYHCSLVYRNGFYRDHCVRDGYTQCTEGYNFCAAGKTCDDGICVAMVARTCNDYPAIAPTCGNQRDYGQRYCRELSRGHALFSSKGKDAVGCVAHCQVEAMRNNSASCDRLDDAYASCFDECRFCQLEVLDYALLWEVVDALDLVSGPTAAFVRKCAREKLEPYAADIALTIVTWLPLPRAAIGAAKVVKKAARVLKAIVKDRRRNNVTGRIDADLEDAEAVSSTVHFEGTTIPLEHHPSTGDTYALNEGKAEASTPADVPSAGGTDASVQ